jgi:integrase
MSHRSTPTPADPKRRRRRPPNGAGGVLWRTSDSRWSARLSRVEAGRQRYWVTYAPRNPNPDRRTPEGDWQGKRQADLLLLQMLAAAAGGLWSRLEAPPAESRSVGALFARFLDEAYAPSVTPEQLKNARGYLANHLCRARVPVEDPRTGAVERVPFADLEARSVGTRAVLELFAERAAAGVGAAVRRHVYNVMAKAWDWFVLREECDANVVRATPRPVVNDQVDREVWTIDEARAFFAHPAVRCDRYEAAYMLGANPGLRIAEVLGLTWADVDEAACQVRVWHQLKRRKVPGHDLKQLVRVDSRKGDFEVAWRGIHPDTAAALVRHRARMAAEAAAHGQELRPESLVFVTPEGRPLDPNDFRPDEFYRVVAAAGARRVDFHSLRYVAETADAMALVPEKVAMQQRGRKTPEMRLHYTRPADEAQVAAGKAGGDLILGNGFDPKDSQVVPGGSTVAVIASATGLAAHPKMRP